MLCEKCGKNEATVAVTIVHENKHSEKQLCANCLKQFHEQMTTGNLIPFLSEILPFLSGKHEEVMGCKHCKKSYDSFQKDGLLGCAHCYDAFSDQLVKYQKSNAQIHVEYGQVMSSGKNENRLERLAGELAAAIECEDYEQAATLRDEINLLSREAE